MRNIIITACVAFLAGWFVNGWRLGETLAQREKSHAEAISQAQKEAKLKLKEQLRQQEIIVNEAIEQKENAIADAKRAIDVSKRLQDRLRALPRPNCTATIIRSASTETAGDMCPELFARIDDVAGEIAFFADRSRIAGLACEKQYESLRK